MSDAVDKHRIPVIDRMMEVLLLLQGRPGGANIRELVEALRLPRSTVYRITNTLQAHGMLRRSAAGSYTLGARLLELAAHVQPVTPGLNLAAIALPHVHDRREMLLRWRLQGIRTWPTTKRRISTTSPACRG